jgi:hypothetical protein
MEDAQTTLADLNRRPISLKGVTAGGSLCQTRIEIMKIPWKNFQFTGCVKRISVTKWFSVDCVITINKASVVLSCGRSDLRICRFSPGRIQIPTWDNLRLQYEA